MRTTMGCERLNPSFLDQLEELILEPPISAYVTAMFDADAGRTEMFGRVEPKYPPHFIEGTAFSSSRTRPCFEPSARSGTAFNPFEAARASKKREKNHAKCTTEAK
jgi:hypothetical protein